MTHLVLLSGWGIDARLWQTLKPHWPANTRISTPNWPGYGGRDALGHPADLATLAEAMQHDLPASSVWVGWSLGALLAASLLAYLPAPRGLIMLGMATRFTTDTVSHGGIPPQELERFHQAFQRTPAKAWHHFLTWQLRGEPSPRSALAQLLAIIGDTPPADDVTLGAGLEQLAMLDVAPVLKHSPCPVRWLYGTQDPFLTAGTPMRDTAQAPLTLEGCGHCPHISAPQQLAREIHALAAAMPGSRQQVAHG
ncbi:alpha/beta fold hydrolase [Halomonas sp. WWR20]